jgi:hypothetical protein
LQLVAMRTYTLCRQLLLPIDVFQEVIMALLFFFSFLPIIVVE